MPINTDNAKMTLDFVYQWENEDGKTEQDMYIRYYISEEYGPTIAISTDQENYTGYPAEMFDEIVEFLNGQLGKKKKEQEIVAVQQPTPSGALPVPTVDRGRGEGFGTIAKQPNIKYSNTTKTEPVQSFNATVSPELENPQKTEKVVAERQETENRAEEEIQAMWQSRQEEVIQKAKTSQKGIKSNHKEQDEDE